MAYDIEYKVTGKERIGPGSLDFDDHVQDGMDTEAEAKVAAKMLEGIPGVESLWIEVRRRPWKGLGFGDWGNWLYVATKIVGKGERWKKIQRFR